MWGWWCVGECVRSAWTGVGWWLSACAKAPASVVVVSAVRSSITATCCLTVPVPSLVTSVRGKDGSGVSGLSGLKAITSGKEQHMWYLKCPGSDNCFVPGPYQKRFLYVLPKTRLVFPVWLDPYRMYRRRTNSLPGYPGLGGRAYFVHRTNRMKLSGRGMGVE